MIVATIPDTVFGVDTFLAGLIFGTACFALIVGYCLGVQWSEWRYHDEWAEVRRQQTILAAYRRMHRKAMR